MSIMTRDSSREALTWLSLRRSTADRSIMRLGYGSPMPRTVLITGGAGFIGSHLAHRLLTAGYGVRVLDGLIEQVHPSRERPPYLDSEVELVVGDVRDRRAVDRALEGVDEVVHLAARVGVGQSMYEVAEYTSVNALGTVRAPRGAREAAGSQA